MLGTSTTPSITFIMIGVQLLDVVGELDSCDDVESADFGLAINARQMRQSSRRNNPHKQTKKFSSVVTDDKSNVNIITGAQ